MNAIILQKRKHACMRIKVIIENRGNIYKIRKKDEKMEGQTEQKHSRLLSQA